MSGKKEDHNEFQISLVFLIGIAVVVFGFFFFYDSISSTFALITVPVSPSTFTPPPPASKLNTVLSPTPTSSLPPSSPTPKASAAPTVDLKVNGVDGSVTVQANSTIIVTWTSTDATSCSVSPIGASGTSGTASVVVASTQKYTVSCFGSGGSPSDSVTVNVVAVTLPDTIVPTVTLLAPIDGAQVSGTVTVSANVIDNVGVAGLQFELDNSPLGLEDTVSPYAINWNTIGVGDGAHTLFALARDTAGNTARSAVLTVTVSNNPVTTTFQGTTGVTAITAPLVSFTQPQSGAVVSGTVGVSVAVQAASNRIITGVQFLLDGVNSGPQITVPPYTASFNTRNLSNGAHSIDVSVVDNGGLVGQDQILITVSNLTSSSNQPSGTTGQVNPSPSVVAPPPAANTGTPVRPIPGPTPSPTPVLTPLPQPAPPSSPQTTPQPPQQPLSTTFQDGVVVQILKAIARFFVQVIVSPFQ